jgi:YtxH-like protein
MLNVVQIASRVKRVIEGRLVLQVLESQPTSPPNVCISTSAEYRHGGTMRFRAREPLFRILLDTGLQLVDSLRDRSPDNMDDIKGKVRDTYSTASDRVSRATHALRGEEESHVFGKAVALAIGVGIGIGIGVLIAPASGEETRADIADKVSDFGDKVNEPSGKKMPSATGTHG